MRKDVLALTLLLAGFLAGGGAAPSRADFAEGLEAYDAGDYVAAIAAWRPLADSGDAAAQVALAGLYANGLGVPADMAEAARLYRAAAGQGESTAQLNLGDLYSRGVGVPRDPVQAYLWLSLAAEQGRGWARKRAAEIVNDLNVEQRAEAERLLATWRRE